MNRLHYAVILFIIGLITYIPSVNGQLFWDDDDFILHNSYVKEFQITKFFTAQAVEGAGKVSNYFRPVQFTTYAIIYKLFGPNPVAFHTISILIHIAATLAVLSFLACLPLPPSTAQLTALLFLIHPVQTEAVSYVSGLSDPLAALFGFLSLVTLIASAKRKTLRVVSVMFFTLTLLSKESGIIFLGLGLLTIVYFHRPLLTCIPYSLITLLYLIYHKWFIDILDLSALYGTVPYAQSGSVRVATFLSLIPTYVQILIAPVTLFYERDFTITRIHSMWYLPSCIVFSIITCIGIILIYHTIAEKKNRLLLFSFLGFLISFVPFSGIVIINAIMYEHFLYLPLIFFFLFVFLAIEQWKATRMNQKTLFVLFSIFFFLLLLRSWSRQKDWQDPVRLYTQTLTYAPNSFRVWNNLGLEYDKRNQPQQAKNAFTHAITYNPTIPNAYHNLGTMYVKENNDYQAEYYFLKAIEIDPSFGYSYSALLRIYQKQGNTQQIQKISEEITKKFK